MKDLNYYLGLDYRIEVVKDEAENGYVLSIPDLKGCVTCADDLDSGMALLADAKEQWIQAAIDCGYEIPEPNTANSYSGQFKLRLPKSLHKELAEESKREGISMNQYCVYLLSRRHPGLGLPRQIEKDKRRSSKKDALIQRKTE
jgi:antitoxin HicB